MKNRFIINVLAILLKIVFVYLHFLMIMISNLACGEITCPLLHERNPTLLQPYKPIVGFTQ